MYRIRHGQHTRLTSTSNTFPTSHRNRRFFFSYGTFTTCSWGTRSGQGHVNKLPYITSSRCWIVALNLIEFSHESESLATLSCSLTEPRFKHKAQWEKKHQCPLHRRVESQYNHSGTQSLQEGGKRLWEMVVQHFRDLCTVPCTSRVPREMSNFNM